MLRILDIAEAPVRDIECTGQIDNAGRDRLIDIISPYYPDDLPHDKQIKRDDLRISWQLSDQKRGKIAKQIKNVMYRDFNVRLPNDVVQSLGDTAATYAYSGQHFVDITQDLRWKDGDFGDGGSCFFSRGSHFRGVLVDSNAYALRFWRRDGLTYVGQTAYTGVGRAWVFCLQDTYAHIDCVLAETEDFDDQQDLIVFNTYPGGYDNTRSAFVLQSLTQANSVIPIDFRCEDLHVNMAAIYLVSSRTYDDLEDLFSARDINIAQRKAPCWLMPDYSSTRFCDRCGDQMCESECFHSDDYHYDYEMLCEDCFSEHYCMCTQCDCTVSHDQAHKQDGDYYCYDCFCEKFCTCELCGNTCDIDDMTRDGDGRQYCDECAADFDRCAKCNDLCTEDSDERETIDGTRAVCQWCFERYYSVCEVCERAAPDHIIDVLDTGDRILHVCPDCAQDGVTCSDCNIAHDTALYVNAGEIPTEHNTQRLCTVCASARALPVVTIEQDISQQWCFSDLLHTEYTALAYRMQGDLFNAHVADSTLIANAMEFSPTSDHVITLCTEEQARRNAQDSLTYNANSYCVRCARTITYGETQNGLCVQCDLALHYSAGEIAEAHHVDRVALETILTPYVLGRSQWARERARVNRLTYKQRGALRSQAIHLLSLCETNTRYASDSLPANSACYRAQRAIAETIVDSDQAARPNTAFASVAICNGLIPQHSAYSHIHNCFRARLAEARTLLQVPYDTTAYTEEQNALSHARFVARTERYMSGRLNRLIGTEQDAEYSKQIAQAISLIENSIRAESPTMTGHRALSQVQRYDRDPHREIRDSVREETNTGDHDRRILRDLALACAEDTNSEGEILHLSPTAYETARTEQENSAL